jgi:ubiquinone/menaquinone biosynthesis C-methylase UbiE
MDHKEYVKNIFDKSAEHYGDKGCAWFEYFGKKLVALANPLRSAKVLDVATGKGAILFPAANAIGTQGSAIGIVSVLK